VEVEVVLGFVMGGEVVVAPIGGGGCVLGGPVLTQLLISVLAMEASGISKPLCAIEVKAHYLQDLYL
jgi:hypothetical protein